jgi:hypothetical protein
MAVHVPLSQEAQAEARVLMLASNNILKPSDGRPVATPTQDMIIGLYHLTGVKDAALGEGKAFGSVAEAQLAFDNKVIDLQAKIRIRLDGSLRETTFGRALFNETLPAGFRYVEQQVGKKEISQIVTELVEQNSRVEVAQTLDRVKDAGFYWATRSGVSMSISDANFDSNHKFDDARALIIKAGEEEHRKKQDEFNNGLISEIERRDALGKLWNARTSEVEKLLKDSIPTDNAIFKMVTSGARGNWIQIRSIMGMRGPVATASGDFAPMPVKGNYLVGLTANEYFINATGARKGNADTAMKTAAAGYLTRRLVDVAQDIIVTELDCGTTRSIPLSLRFTDKLRDELVFEAFAPEKLKLDDEYESLIELGKKAKNPKAKLSSDEEKKLAELTLKFEQKSLKTRLAEAKEEITKRVQKSPDSFRRELESRPDMRLEGNLSKSIDFDKSTRALFKYLAKDFVDISGHVLVKRGELLTTSIFDMLVEESKTRVFLETPAVRSVLTCESTRGVCAKCYGTSLATGKEVEIGEAVGVIAAQSIGEPGTQLTMRTFHTGGASDNQEKQVIKKRIGGIEMRVEREISYDITQGLTGVTDQLEARIGWNRQGKVAVMAFWPGMVNIREVDTKSLGKKYEIRVVPLRDTNLEEAKTLALGYVFNRTTSKTFKKLDPELPLAIVSSLEDVIVEDGDYVEPGDYLVDGTPIPHEALATKGRVAAALEIINGVQAIYGAQGVDLNDKHLEVIVRQMLGKVTVVDGGETNMLPGEILDRNAFMVRNREAVSNGKKPASAREEVMGMTRASLAAQSWLSAASFQETTRVLTQAALDRRTDPLVGLKENVIIGKLIPAGTGLKEYRNIKVEATEEAKNEMYPNRIWAAPVQNDEMDLSSFGTTGLAFTSIEEFDQAGDEETAK